LRGRGAGAARKVSDEFTVPLCAIHHQQNHATGNERQWWQEQKIDPLPVAERLWQQSR
jgi:tRNA A37 threonylcarbamoyltransferase TsaD